MPSLNWALKRTWLLDCIGSLIGSWALNQSLLYVYNRNNREVHCKSLFGNNYFIIVVIIKELLVVIIKKLNSWLKLLINVPRSLKMVVWYISQWLVFGLGTKTVNLAIVFLVLLTFLWNYFEKCLFSDTITLRFSLSCTISYFKKPYDGWVVSFGSVLITTFYYFVVFLDTLIVILHYFEWVRCFLDPIVLL